MLRSERHGAEQNLSTFLSRPKAPGAFRTTSSIGLRPSILPPLLRADFRHKICAPAGQFFADLFCDAG